MGLTNQKLSKKLMSDNDIIEAYNDPNVTIYFREGDEEPLNPVINFSLEILLDATCHGFEFFAFSN